MPTLCSYHFFAGVLGRAARVPDREIVRAETALQVFAGSGWLFVQRQRDRAADSREDLGGQRQTLGLPGEQSAI
jgi:hypothetical protein